MPIQFPDFNRISFDEANPYLTGVGKGQDMMQKFLQFPQELQKQILANQIASVNAKYAEPMAKGNLTKLNLENEWTPKLNQSTIGLQGAQAGQAGAQAKYLGSETSGKNIENEQSALILNMLKKSIGEQQASRNGAQSSPSMSGQVGQPQQQGIQSSNQTQQPFNNSIYGIETPPVTPDDIINKKVFGIDTYTPKKTNAQQQQQSQFKSYQDALVQSIKDANSANSMNQAISVFNNAMDNSTAKGSRWGNLPSSGLWKLPGDFSQEQIADRAALQMVPAAIETLKDSMGSSRFSNLDMQMATKMKFDRTMDDDTRKTQTNWINGVNERMKENSKFLSTLANPQSGAKKTDADLLWAAYQQDFPLISSDGRTFKGSNLGNWPLYTTPRAIASIKATGSYTPTKSEMNTFMMKYPDGKVLPVKKGGVENAFKKGARPL